MNVHPSTEFHVKKKRFLNNLDVSLVFSNHTTKEHMEIPVTRQDLMFFDMMTDDHNFYVSHDDFVMSDGKTPETVYMIPRSQLSLAAHVYKADVKDAIKVWKKMN